MTFAELLGSGKAGIEGDATGLERVFEAITTFDLLFEIIPGTVQTDRT